MFRDFRREMLSVKCGKYNMIVESRKILDHFSGMHAYCMRDFGPFQSKVMEISGGYTKVYKIPHKSAVVQQFAFFTTQLCNFTNFD